MSVRKGTTEDYHTRGERYKGELPCLKRESRTESTMWSRGDSTEITMCEEIQRRPTMSGSGGTTDNYRV